MLKHNLQEYSTIIMIQLYAPEVQQVHIYNIARNNVFIFDIFSFTTYMCKHMCKYVCIDDHPSILYPSKYAAEHRVIEIFLIIDVET